MMSDADERITSTRLVVGGILAMLVLTGPLGIVDVTGERVALDDGTATLSVDQPDSEAIRITDGRFGTNVSYVRIPDLLVTVEELQGQPRVLYIVKVPALGISADNRRLVESEGRLRVPLRDRAVTGEVSGTYEGRVIVRVQSFSGMRTISNRTIEVRAG